MSAFDAAVCPPGIYGCVQSLWEYGHELLSTVMPAITIDFEAVLRQAQQGASAVETATQTVRLPVVQQGTCHGIIIFMRTYFDLEVRGGATVRVLVHGPLLLLFCFDTFCSNSFLASFCRHAMTSMMWEGATFHSSKACFCWIPRAISTCELASSLRSQSPSILQLRKTTLFLSKMLPSCDFHSFIPSVVVVVVEKKKKASNTSSACHFWKSRQRNNTMDFVSRPWIVDTYGSEDAIVVKGTRARRVQLVYAAPQVRELMPCVMVLRHLLVQQVS